MIKVNVTGKWSDAQALLGVLIYVIRGVVRVFERIESWVEHGDHLITTGKAGELSGQLPA
jgi:hypothetical protein